MSPETVSRMRRKVRRLSAEALVAVIGLAIGILVSAVSYGRQIGDLEARVSTIAISIKRIEDRLIDSALQPYVRPTSFNHVSYEPKR